MSFRKHLDWDSKHMSMIGYTDLGSGSINSDSQREAYEIMVVMAVGITGRWQVTLKYFLIVALMPQFTHNWSL